MAILCLLCRSSKGDKYNHTTKNKLQFHKLPNDESLKTSWLDAIKLSLGEQWTLKSKHAYICSEHFLPEDYIPSGCSRRLKPKSVPSQKLAAESDIVNKGRHQDDSKNVFIVSSESFAASSSPIQKHKVLQSKTLTPDNSETKEPQTSLLQGRKQLYIDLCKSWNLELDKINRSEQPLTCSSFLELCSLEQNTEKTMLKLKKIEGKEQLRSSLDKLRMKLRFVQSDLKKTKEKLVQEKRTSHEFKKEASKYKQKYLNTEQRRVRGQKKIRNLTAKLLRRDKKCKK